MPRGMEHCCLTSCGFCCLPAQPPWEAQVGLSSRTVIAVTLWDAYLVQALPGMSPSIGLGNRSKSHITALTVGLFLALVRLHLATVTGFLCGAESRVSLGSEVMALKTVPVSWSQASSKSHPNRGQKPPSHSERWGIQEQDSWYFCMAQSSGARQPLESCKAVGHQHSAKTTQGGASV